MGDVSNEGIGAGAAISAVMDDDSDEGLGAGSAMPAAMGEFTYVTDSIKICSKLAAIAQFTIFPIDL